MASDLEALTLIPTILAAKKCLDSPSDRVKGSDILKELRVQPLFLLLHPSLEVFQTHLTGRRTCYWDYISHAVKECLWIRGQGRVGYLA